MMQYQANRRQNTELNVPQISKNYNCDNERIPTNTSYYLSRSVLCIT